MMRKGIWIFIIPVLVLIIGGYLFSQKFSDTSSSNNNFKENEINCNVGNSRFTPIPEGISAGV